MCLANKKAAQAGAAKRPQIPKRAAKPDRRRFRADRTSIPEPRGAVKTSGRSLGAHAEARAKGLSDASRGAKIEVSSLNPAPQEGK